MLSRLFPYHNYRIVRFYYALYILLDCWIIAGIWYFVFRHFLSNTRIGISDAIIFGIGFLFELPSGVWADLVGRHKAVRLGFVGMVLGNVIIAFGSSFWSITIGGLVWVIGYTFQSGALDALVYDHLLQEHPETIETIWPSIISRAQMYGRIMTLLCTLIGSLLYSVWFRLPYLSFAVVSLTGLCIALRLPADTMARQVQSSWKLATYKQQINRGIRVMLTPEVRIVTLLALLVGSLDYAMSWGILRPLVGVRFHFTSNTLPLLQVIGSVAIVIALLLSTKKLRNQKAIGRLIGWLAVAYGACFVGFDLSHKEWLGGSLYILVEVTSAVVAVAFSVYINQHTKSQHRATTLSTVSMLERAPYAFLAILLGWLAGNGLIGIFCLIAGAIVVLITLLSLPAWMRNNKHIERL